MIYDDFSIDYVGKRIYHSSGTTVYSANALYSWLMDTMDELGQMDDDIPMSAQTPTEYTLINGWHMDDESFKYIDGGAIKTSGWLNEIHVVSFASGGYTSAVAGDIGKMVNDDGVDFGTLLAYDNTLRKWWIRTGSATTMASGSVVTIDSGTGGGTTSAISATGENLWANIYSLGTIEAGSQLYIEQAGSVLSSWWSTGHIDVLIKVKEAGTEINGAVVTVFARELSDIYDHYEVDLSSGGRLPIPLATSNDLNNQTASATIEDWQDGTISTIAVSFGTYAADVSGDSVNENYDVQIDCNSQAIENVYEVLKFWTRRGTAKTLNGVSGDIYRSADPAYTEVKGSPFGTFAGGKFFGARGVYLINVHGDDIQAYQLIDADGNTVTPPNLQSFQVNGVVSGDRVGVMKASAGEIDKAQYSLSGANTLNTITVSGAIPQDTPTTGTIIVVDDDGTETAYAYSAWSGSAFTVSISAGVYSGTETAYVPYILAEASSTSVSVAVMYVSSRDVITRVRKKGILPFQTLGTFGSTGYSVTAIRTEDSIVT